jgi:uncharacterized membrane protein YhhN
MIASYHQGSDNRLGTGLLLVSLVFGLAYLADAFGFQAPYPWNAVIKTTSVACLALYAFSCRQMLLGVALAFGAAGDAFLAMQPQQTELGIIAFGIGHLGFIVLFAVILANKGTRGILGYLAAFVVAAVGTGLVIWLQPYFGDVRVPATIYNGIIVVMAMLAVIGRGPALAIIGAVLFVASDGVLAARMFAGMLEWSGPLSWALYYSAQVCLAVGLARRD